MKDYKHASGHMVASSPLRLKRMQFDKTIAGYFLDLANSGLFGRTPEEIARELIMEGIRKHYTTFIRPSP